MTSMPGVLSVVFEDDNLLVIDKPANLVVTESVTQKEVTLEELLREQFKISLERGGLVHRLDKDTSGLILAAKSKEVLEALQAQFKNREVKKEYLTLVHGQVRENQVIARTILRNPGNREKFTVGVEGLGKESATRIEPEQNFQFSDNFQTIFEDFNKIQKRKLEKLYHEGFTLVRCFPLTGRTHQIRVHLKYINHPIVSDEKYGGRKVYRLDKRWCPRQFLHAARIGFYHPVSGEWIEVESKLPKDLQQSLEILSTKH